MSEYEIAELTMSAMGNFLATLGVFLSIVTAYIVATYIAAKRLTFLHAAMLANTATNDGNDG